MRCATIATLRASPKTATVKAKFILATDGETVEAEDLVGGDVIACAYADLPRHLAMFLPLVGISTVARLEGALKERQTVAKPATVSTDVALVNAALAEAKKAYRAGRGDILDRLKTKILALARQLGFRMLEEVNLNTNAPLRLAKGGEPTTFSAVTAGERLRLCIATAVALLCVGQERGLGRHPGLLIVASPAAEEVSPHDLTAVLSELQTIAQKTESLQIIIGSASATAMVAQLGEQWCRSAMGNYIHGVLSRGKTYHSPAAI